MEPKNTLGHLLCQYEILAGDVEYHERRLAEAREAADDFAREHLFRPMYEAGCFVRHGGMTYEYNPEFDTITASERCIPSSWEIAIEEAAGDDEGQDSTDAA